MVQDLKSRLRGQLKGLLGGICDGDRGKGRGQSRLVCERIGGLDLYRSASVVMAYASLPSEISVDALIRCALRDGKRVCVPGVDWEGGTMRGVEIFNLDADLVIGRYGLRSPRSGCETVPDAQIGLALIPGLGFDRSGNRLGRGAGFYDRWIGSRRRETGDGVEPTGFLGVCFDEQIVAEVPTDAHDQLMDRVVTPTATY